MDLAQHCLALPALAACLAAVGALEDEAEVAAEQHNLVAGGRVCMCVLVVRV